jgi:hypothetical protein
MLTFCAQHSLTFLLIIIGVSIAFETTTAFYVERRVWGRESLEQLGLLGE